MAASSTTRAAGAPFGPAPGCCARVPLLPLAANHQRATVECVRDSVSFERSYHEKYPAPPEAVQHYTYGSRPGILARLCGLPRPLETVMGSDDRRWANTGPEYPRRAAYRSR